MTIQIPDDLARSLEGMAQRKSVGQVAIEQLRTLLDEPTSPASLLHLLQSLPHPSAAAMDDLDAAIASARMPVREQGFFEQ